MDSSSGHTMIRWGGGNEEGTRVKKSHLNSVCYRSLAVRAGVAIQSFLSPLSLLMFASYHDNIPHELSIKAGHVPQIIVLHHTLVLTEESYAEGGG